MSKNRAKSKLRRSRSGGGHYADDSNSITDTALSPMGVCFSETKSWHSGKNRFDWRKALDIDSEAFRVKRLRRKYSLSGHVISPLDEEHPSGW